MLISIIDAAVHYDCPYHGQVYILVLCINALIVPSMQNNLIPRFVMGEAGIRVNDTPKIQTVELTEEDHSIYFLETDIWILLEI